jgi:hypothetical protein
MLDATASVALTARPAVGQVLPVSPKDLGGKPLGVLREKGKVRYLAHRCSIRFKTKQNCTTWSFGDLRLCALPGKLK